MAIGPKGRGSSRAAPHQASGRGSAAAAPTSVLSLGGSVVTKSDTAGTGCLATPSRRTPAGLAATLRRRNAELSVLNALGLVLNSSLELADVLGLALQVLLDGLHYRAVSVMLPDWGTLEIEVHSRRRGKERAEAAFKRLDLLALPMPASGTGPLATSPIIAEAVPKGLPGPLLVAPVTARGRTLGLVVAVPAADRRSHLRGRHLLGGIAGQLGMAIANARLFDRARLEADQLAALNAIGSAIGGSLRVPELLDQALRQLLEVSDLEFGVIHLFTGEGDDLYVAARSGLAAALASSLGQQAREACAGSAGNPIIREALLPGPIGQRRVERVPRCLMHIALLSPERPLGILTVGSYTQPNFSPGATELLDGIAGRISLALAKALLYAELQHREAELAQANEALHEALRGKDQFLANVTHELRRPLAPARLVLETLLETPEARLPAGRREKLLRIALSNLDSMNALVSELLDAVRLQRQPLPPHVETFDLRTVTRRSIATMRPLARARRIRLQTIIPSTAIPVRGDPAALTRVIANLLSNACKFNRESGSILVQLEMGESQVLLAVTDTGTGIPAHARQHIFERFYQADGSARRAHEGLGLGLYIAREIVIQHGGQIRFDTEEGVGTTFTITLPLA